MSTLLKGDARRRRWTAIAVGALALIGHVSSLAALDFPGPAPGPATVTVEAGRYKLENSAISMSWQLTERTTPTGAGGRSVVGQDDLRRQRSFCGCAGRWAHYPRLRHEAPCEQPRSEDLAANPASVRAANHHAGKCISATLASTDGSLQVQWRAMLRDGDNYVRQELTLRARGKDLPLAEIVLIELPAEGAQTVGSVRGSPVVAGNLFFACENPLANNRGQAWPRSLRVAVERAASRPAKTLGCASVVGVAPAGQMRRAFLCYVERERARPYQPFLHYNSWYDIAWADRKMNEAQCLAVIDVFGREFVAETRRAARLVRLRRRLGRQPNALGLPCRLSQRLPAAERRRRQYHSAVGVWLSPWGGYGPAQSRAAQVRPDTRFRDQRPRLRPGRSEILCPLPRRVPANDGEIRRELLQVRRRRRRTGYEKLNAESLADMAALVRLCDDLRQVRPDVYISLTTGTWPSPYWLWHGDSIWRNGADSDFCGQGSMRQQWINYRDATTQQMVVRRGPLFPLNSVMNQGIIFAQLGNGARMGNDLKDVVDEFRMFFGSGTQLQELYMTPQMMTPAMWDALAEAAAWSRNNADVLVDTHWIGGDAAKGEPYGYASWSPRKGILCVRNPSRQPKTLTLKLADAFELAPGRPRQYTLKSPWKADANLPARTRRCGGGVSHRASTV